MAYVRYSSEFDAPREPLDPMERERRRREYEAEARRARRRQAVRWFWTDVRAIPSDVRDAAGQWRADRDEHWSRRERRRPERSNRFLGWLVGEALDDAVQRAVSNLVHDLEARLVTALFTSLVVGALLDVFGLVGTVAGTAAVGATAGAVALGAGGSVPRGLAAILGAVFASLMTQAADHLSSEIARGTLPDVWGIVETKWMLSAVLGWAAGTLVRTLFTAGWVGKVVSGGIVAVLGVLLWYVGRVPGASSDAVQLFAAVPTGLARWIAFGAFVVGTGFLIFRFVRPLDDFYPWLADHRWIVYLLILCAIGAAAEGSYTSAALFVVVNALIFIFPYDMAMWVMGYLRGVLTIPSILWVAGRRIVARRRTRSVLPEGERRAHPEE